MLLKPMLLKFLTEDQKNAISAICYELEKKYPGITGFINQMVLNNESVLDLQVFLITDSIYHEYTFDLGLILENNEMYINEWKTKNVNEWKTKNVNENKTKNVNENKTKNENKIKNEEPLGARSTQLSEVYEIHTHSLKKPVRLFWKIVDPVKFKLVPVKNKIKCKLVSLKNKIWKI